MGALSAGPEMPEPAGGMGDLRGQQQVPGGPQGPGWPWLVLTAGSS